MEKDKKIKRRDRERQSKEGEGEREREGEGYFGNGVSGLASSSTATELPLSNVILLKNWSLFR